MSSIEDISKSLNQKPDLDLQWLDSRKRPVEIERRITHAFQNCREYRAVDTWGFHGAKSYGLCGINEQRLVKKIIQSSSDERKEFYALDIGGGDFSWSHSLADFIDAQPDFSPEIKVHIIGTRAEKDSTPKIEKTPRCVLHNMQEIRAEHLSEDFQAEGLDLINKIDLIVSRMCFRHLVDPVGALVDSLTMLRPKTGFLLSDGFVFAFEGQPNFERTYHEVSITTENLMRVLLDTKAPFLTNLKNNTYPCQFIIQRPDEGRCRLPMNYTGRLREVEQGEIASRVVTEFRRIHLSEEQWPKVRMSPVVVQGDRQLYEWIRQNHLFKCPRMVWNQIFGIKTNRSNILQAIFNGDQQEIERLLSDPQTSLNVSDTYGNSAYHFAIYKRDVKTLQVLLDRGADFELCTKKGETPLHFAAEYDKTGEITTLLVRANVQLNSLKIDGDEDLHSIAFGGFITPLDHAIIRENLVVGELLIKAGARICTTKIEDFKNFALPLLERGTISSTQMEQSAIPVEKEAPFFSFE
jgi:hypothetical protein